MAEAAAGAGLPQFVEREFREFLTCGVLSRRAPPCAVRRSSGVDAVVPHVPVRQWVLTLRYRLRYLVAWNHKLCRAVLAVHVRTVLGF